MHYSSIGQNTDMMNNQATPIVAPGPNYLTLDDILLFFCPKCNKKYQHKGNLHKHLRYECGVEPKFCCYFCPKKFKQKSNLKEHLRCVHDISGQQITIPN